MNDSTTIPLSKHNLFYDVLQTSKRRPNIVIKTILPRHRYLNTKVEFYFFFSVCLLTGKSFDRIARSIKKKTLFLFCLYVFIGFGWQVSKKKHIFAQFSAKLQNLHQGKSPIETFLTKFWKYQIRLWFKEFDNFSPKKNKILKKITLLCIILSCKIKSSFKRQNS